MWSTNQLLEMEVTDRIKVDRGAARLVGVHQEEGTTVSQFSTNSPIFLSRPTHSARITPAIKR